MDMQKEREAFECLPWVKGIIDKGVFEYSDYTKSYVFKDAMTCINARPSQHKDHGYLNGAWEAWQAAKAESHKSASLYQWEINHLAAANQQWRDYAEKVSAVPDGYCIVPKEPSAKMVDAGHNFCKTNIVTPTGFYEAMIKAAQELPGV